MNLIAITKLIQSKIGASPDGQWGPESATKTAAALSIDISDTTPISPITPTLPHPSTGICPFAQLEMIPGGQPQTPVYIVQHDTSGDSAQSSIDSWRSSGSGICTHFVIDRDGAIYQARDIFRTCGHTGIDPWTDPVTGALHYGLNPCSVGIELANADSETEIYPWCRANVPGFSTIQARHPNGGPVQAWEIYYPAQIDALIKLINWIVQMTGITRYVGHETIAPNRRNDPGPAFPWSQVRQATGLLQ